MKVSWAAGADVIGHCMLTFAFLPTLASVPGWLYFEAHNSLNLRDPIVLAFVPARGVLRLLDAFSAGVVERVLAGVVYGGIVCAWLSTSRAVSTPAQRAFRGAVGGAVTASLIVLGVMCLRFFRAGALEFHARQIAFEIVSGVLCGVVAMPTAVRLSAAGQCETASVSASQA